MNTEKKKRHNHWYTLLLCIVAMAIAAIIFALLSVFGVFRYWQAEKIEQGETELSFTQAAFCFWEAVIRNQMPCSLFAMVGSYRLICNFLKSR